MTWALLLLPTGQVMKRLGWRKVETVWNGGFFARTDGLLTRCRGLDVSEGVRWWHVIVGRQRGTVTPADVDCAIDTFFPETAMVLEVHLPEEVQDAQEAIGQVVHLWWCVDGNSGVPAINTWEMQGNFEPDEQAPTWED